MRFLLPLLFLALPLCAQKKITLSQAIQTALENHYGIKIEKINSQISQINNHRGEAGGLPRLTLNIAQANSFTDVVNPASFIQGTTLRNNLNPSITLDWVLFDGFRASIAKDRLEKLQAESQASAEVIIESTIQNAILGFYRALLEKERNELSYKALRLSYDRYNYVRERKEMGLLTTADILTFQTAYLTDSVAYLNQMLAYRTALRDLQWLINDTTESEPVGEFSLPDEEFTFETLLQAAAGSNANLRKEFITLEIARLNTALTHADQYPRINLTVNYSYDRARQDISNASLPPTFKASPVNFAHTNAGGVNFSISYVLYNGGRVQRAQQVALLREQAQNLRLEQLKANISRELLNEFSTYQSRKAILDVTAQTAIVAQTNFEVAKERFEAGLISSLDYRSIQNALLAAEFARLSAAYNAIISLVNLQRLTGGILDVK